jgi:hypothetical protein
MRSKTYFVLSATLAVIAATQAHCKGPRYTDPAKADADFRIQGEYSGQLTTTEGSVKVGVQVIALGGGKFRAVVFIGGLPGDGWDKSDKEEVEAQAKDGVVTFVGKNGTGTIKDGAMHVVDKQDRKMGQLKRVVRFSPTLGKKPPTGAVVLFDGSSAENFEKGRMTEDGLLMPGTTSKARFGNHKLHLEFLLPYQPEDRGQGRGNSGVYLQGRYEVQMLDSFGLAGKHNECGGIYSVKDPDVNMCFPPLQWQTYDVEYTAAEYDQDGRLVSNPRMTVRHNGVVIHDDVELPGDRNTTAAPLGPGKEPGPVFLQDHGCPVRYRNIWVHGS